jgi:hypothetical protein
MIRMIGKLIFHVVQIGCVVYNHIRVTKRFENSEIIEFRHIKDTRYDKIITGNAQDILRKIEFE